MLFDWIPRSQPGALSTRLGASQLQGDALFCWQEKDWMEVNRKCENMLQAGSD